MPLEMETAKGMAEKILPIVRFPIFMRVILPGSLASAIVYPFTGLRGDFISSQFKDVWRELVLLLAAVFVFGAIISALSREMYKIYEGRILWPQGLFDWFRARHQAKIGKLLAKADRADKAGRPLRYDEIWYRLRMYPLNADGDPYASHPTLLGNILAEYEDYPRTRYRMDSVFYWDRIWLAMDKEKREQVDAEWSVADGFLGLSAVSFCGGIIWISAAVLKYLSLPLPHVPFGAPKGSAIGGIILLALGYGFYRLSLPFHRSNGETFKAIFDLYRVRIQEMLRLGPAEFAAWENTWAYLQYLLVSCASCGNQYAVAKPRCERCGYETLKSLRKLGGREDKASRPETSQRFE